MFICLFIYYDPSAGSPTETLLRLLLPLDNKAGRTFGDKIERIRVFIPIRAFHRIIQSVGATGGVYKGQGRIQRELMTHAYKAFLVQDEKLQSSIPSTMQIPSFPTPYGEGD